MANVTPGARAAPRGRQLGKTWRRDLRFTRKPCWTTWTFGVWYVKPPKLRYETFGIDLGPWSLVWRKQ